VANLKIAVSRRASNVANAAKSNVLEIPMSSLRIVHKIINWLFLLIR
jgi:hypothetical protein